MLINDNPKHSTESILADRFSVYSNDEAVVHVLPNGMTLIMEQLPYLRSFSVGVWIRAGSGNEAPAQNGISHFLEHLLFKGTLTRTARELMDAIESKGGQLNAFTSRDYTCIYVRALDTQVATAIAILADIVRNATFCDLEKERNVVVEEIASAEDVPEDYIHDLYSLQLWPEHALGRPVAGTVDTVSAMGYEDVREYHRQWYRPRDMFFAIAGNIEPKAVLEQVEQEFSPIEDALSPPRPEAPRPAQGLVWHESSIGQDHLCFGFPGCAITDPARYHYEMLSSILGGGSTSRLFERIREEAGLAYSIYTFNLTYSKAGTLGVYAAVAPENLGTASDLAAQELRGLVDTPVSAVEMESNREQLKGSMLMALESTFTRMARLARSMMHHGRLIGIDEVVQAIDAVTADDIQRLAQRLFTTDMSAFVVLGPKENTKFQGLRLG
jgi:predicted Zn-dependent peptidase